MMSLAFAVALSVAAPAASPLDSVVAAHYPNFLAGQSALHRYADEKQQSYVELTARSIAYVVAAYSNGEIGAVVLLEKTSGGYRVATEITRESGQVMVGKDPELKTLDVDGDGTPEVVAAFTDHFDNRETTWVFRLTDGHLQLISPTESGWTMLGAPAFLDLNGKGTLDMIDNVVVARNARNVKIEQEHYALQNGVYVALKPVDFYEAFWSGGKLPVTRTFSVPAASVGKRGRLILVNGDAAGAPYRVVSGEVILNGTAVSVQPGTCIARVRLKKKNVLRVSVRGGELARVGVVVRHD